MRAKVGFGAIEGMCISHLHGDHVTGIPGLLMTLGQSSRRQPLTLYGPPGLQPYIRGTMDNLSIHPAYDVIVLETEGGIICEGTGYWIEAAPADHSLFTLAYAFNEHQRPGLFDIDQAKHLGIPEGPLYRELQQGKDIRLRDGRIIHAQEVVGPPRSGRKIVYAIDTRPCSTVTELARGADILIHDGMFTEDMRSEAQERGHSTTRQAAEVATEAGVEKLILVHISPRYEDEAVLLKEAREVFPNTVIAQDLMTIDVPVHK
jgi:ribonuclease Z